MGPPVGGRKRKEADVSSGQKREREWEGLHTVGGGGGGKEKIKVGGKHLPKDNATGPYLRLLFFKSKIKNNRLPLFLIFDKI